METSQYPNLMPNYFTGNTPILIVEDLNGYIGETVNIGKHNLNLNFSLNLDPES